MRSDKRALKLDTGNGRGAYTGPGARRLAGEHRPAQGTSMTTLDRFFTAFQALDSAAMLACYHPDAHFQDPVFDLHGTDEIGAMWTSLCRGAQDFSLDYEIRDTVDGVVHATWRPSYRFPRTNRMVHNIITTEMTVAQGLIEQHHDSFDLSRWCRQALGLPGVLLGWSKPFQRQVRAQARQSIGLG